MRQGESRRLLSGVVFFDEAVLGGAQARKRGRGLENTQPFMAAAEFTEEAHSLHIRVDAIADDTGENFAARAQAALHPTVHLLTARFGSFNVAGAQVLAHGAVIGGEPTSSKLEPFRRVNGFISNLKTAISGTYHQLDLAKHPRRYLADAQHRVNHCSDLASLFGGLADTCVQTAPPPARKLRLAETGAAERSR